MGKYINILIFKFYPIFKILKNIFYYKKKSYKYFYTTQELMYELLKRFRIAPPNHLDEN